MKVQAAICWEPRRPLEIDEVDLDGPKAGECLVRLAATGVCHTDAYTMSGRDPSGLFPSVLGHEGAGVVEEVGPGVDVARRRRSRDPALHPRVPQLRVLSLAARRISAARSWRPRARGMMPDGTSRLSHRGRPLHHYMGTSTFATYTVVPEIALAKIRKDAPLDEGVPARLRRHHRHRRGAEHREGRAGLDGRGLRSRRHRAVGRSRVP